MPQPFLGPPFRAFPSQQVSDLSRSPNSHAVIHQPAELRASEPFSQGFRDAHAFAQLPASSSAYGVPFCNQNSHVPVPLGSGPRSQLLQPASPTSKHSSCESVSPAPSCPDSRDRCSPGLLPSRAFSFCTSGPRPARARKLEHPPPPERFGERPRGALTPPGRVRPLPHRSEEANASTASGLLRGQPAPPLDGAPTPLTFQALGRTRQPLASEAFKYAESGVPPKRSPALLRFLALSTPSRL